VRIVGALTLCVVLTVALGADEPRLVIDSGGHQALIKFLAFTRDGKSLVSAGHDKEVRIWDIASGKTVRTILGQVGDGPEGKIYAAALSPDEHYLAVGGWLTASDNSDVIRIHDFSTGEVVALLKGHTNVVHALAFSADGRWLASGSGDNTVRIWDRAGWKPIQTLSGHHDDVYAVAFSPDSKRLVSGSHDKTLRLWDRASGRLLKEIIGHQGEVKTVAFSPDDRYIASGGEDRIVKLWNGHSGALIRDLAAQGSLVSRLVFSPDSRVLLTAGGEGDNVCHVFEVPSGREVTHFSRHANTVAGAAFSADGKTVATGDFESKIFLWNPANAAVLHKLAGNGSQTWAVGYGRDGKSIAFGTTLRLTNWNDTGPLEKTILLTQAQDHRISVSPSVQNPDDFMRARDRVGDFALRLKGVDATTLQILQGTQVKYEITRAIPTGNRHIAYSLSPNSTLAASGGDYGILNLYSTSTGNRSASCVGHTSSIWSLAFSSDGNTLVSGSADQTVRLWEITPSSCRNLLTFFVTSDNEWVAWTPQGYYTSSASGDKYIGWHVNQGLDHAAKFYPAAQFQKQFYRPDVVVAFLSTRDIDAAVKTANERRGGEFRSQPVFTSANVQAWLPPLISISSPPRDALTVTGKSLRVRAEVLSNTLPIADVKVLLNGVLVSAKDNPPPAGAMRHQLDLEAGLEEGVNILSIMASNEKAMSEPETRKIVYHSTSGAGTKPKLIAVAVGVSRYSRQGISLKYGDADAAAMETALKNQLDPQGGLFSDVKVHVLPNDKANRSDIVRELNWMNREATQRDTRVLFLSGHGAVDSRNNYFFFSHEHDPDDYDLGDVPWDLIIRKLAASGRAILFVDSCHAGAVTGNQRKADAKTLAQIIKEASTDQPGLVTFASSERSEDSQELDNFKHGAFTQALIEGINDRKADLNGDGVIETEELALWIVQRVRELTGGTQHAVYVPAPGASSFALFRGKP
jgi:WD40 repeat protein